MHFHGGKLYGITTTCHILVLIWSNRLNLYEANPKQTFYRSREQNQKIQNQSASIPLHHLDVSTHPLFPLVYPYVISCMLSFLVIQTIVVISTPADSNAILFVKIFSWYVITDLESRLMTSQTFLQVPKLFREQYKVIFTGMNSLVSQAPLMQFFVWLHIMS